MEKKLKEYGVKYDLITYRNSGHSLGDDKKSKEKAYKTVREYAKQYLA